MKLRAPVLGRRIAAARNANAELAARLSLPAVRITMPGHAWVEPGSQRRRRMIVALSIVLVALVGLVLIATMGIGASKRSALRGSRAEPQVDRRGYPMTAPRLGAVDALVAEGLEKRYGNVQALAGVSFRVRAGEVFALLGPNGAGKSTTVKVLTTLTRPDGGRGEVAGHDVVHEPDAVRRSIGYVPQSSGIDRDATGRENLMLQGHIQGLGGRELRERVGELLGLVGIADAADRVVRGYSGGMKRRLDVALGLVHRPKVFFLDEPTTGLDPEARAAMWEELGVLAHRESLTILLTTHYLEEADQLADRLAIVSRGRVVVDGTPDELKQTLEGEVVEVEISDGAVEDAAAIVRALDEVREVTLNGRRLRSRVANGARAVPTILSALDGRGVGVEAVTMHRPSLDNVYLHYTGREFSAEDEAGAGVDVQE